MSSCLGIYIEKNLIKYAKVTKEKEKVKIETFGIKSYDNLEQTIEQIIEETFSFKTPISVNITGEQYIYSNMFALLQDRDLEKAAETEFGAIMTERGQNPEALDMKKIYVPKVGEKDKLKVVYVAANRTELNERMKWFQKNKVTGIFATAMTLPNLLDTDEMVDSLIINMDEQTTVTKIINNRIYNVEVLEQNSREVLNKINQKENSHIKSYEACKNTTIYTSEGSALQEYEMGYLEEIMPTIFQIVESTQKVINDNEVEIKKVYLTGTLAMISNIDLYFQEHLADVKCEILRPGYVQPAGNTNIKDYIEMNSPVSLALAAMGEGVKGINFKKVSKLDQISFGGGEGKSKTKDGKMSKINITNNLTEKLDGTEIRLLRTAILVLVVFFTYAMLSNEIIVNTQEKIEELAIVQVEVGSQINSANSDKTKLDNIQISYQQKIENIENIENILADIDQTRNRIPNLLQHVMHIIPEGVQLISIKNEAGNQVEIKFQSDKYEQIGYFTAKIKEEKILENVETSSSEKTR